MSFHSLQRHEEFTSINKVLCTCSTWLRRYVLALCFVMSLVWSGFCCGGGGWSWTPHSGVFNRLFPFFLPLPAFLIRSLDEMKPRINRRQGSPTFYSRAKFIDVLGGKEGSLSSEPKINRRRERRKLYSRAKFSCGLGKTEKSL